MRRRFLRTSDDEGAALVMVLIIVTVLALGLSALLSLSDTSIRATVGLRGQAAATYNADGAMQAAINNLRNSSYNDASGQKCFGSGVTASNTLHLDGFYGSDSAAVDCAADPKKVLIQCPSLSKCNRPGNAILTLGKIADEDGLTITQPTGSTFRVHGNVFSNSNINVANGALNTNANVWARTSCNGTIQSTPAASCHYGYPNPPNPLGDDPGYTPKATIASLPHRSLPNCTSPNSVIRFQPGYYDDAKGLTDMMAGNSLCKNSTWWFPPVYDGAGHPSATGVYYFDFHNSGSNANPILDSNGGNVWTVNDGHLVAGTPLNAAGAVVAAPPTSPTPMPGSCDNPIKRATAIGVQFIFGGDSQFAVKSGEAEICGTYDVDTAPVAVYGLTSGSESPTAWVGANALRLSTVTPGDFTDATAAKLGDVDTTTFASWKSGSKNASGLVTVDGFAPTNPVPPGSVLQSATVKVTHRHTDSASTDDLSVSVDTGSGPNLTGSVTGHNGSNPPSAFQTDSIPIDATRKGDLAQAIYAGTYSGAKIAVTTSLKAKGDSENIDAIQLELSYIAPAFRAGSGCITTGPYNGAGSGYCALVKSVNNVGNLFFIQGTTYTPGAVVDIALNNSASEVFRFGVIARSVWIKETGSYTLTTPVIEVPDDSPGFVFSLYLSVYICPSAGTCSPSGSPVLRSKVALVDTNPTTPVPGHRQVTVLSWTRPG
ncbi:MAG: hypothetical protein QOG10_6143 [Kribbellaceae bacterium]|jgi:hypothetical protein|nr:hypothetical protein [Kribbellaceae bacterium]